jgi:hypothetical protein
VNASNLLVYIIETSVAISAVMVVALVVLLLVVRVANETRRRRREALTTRWRNVFKTAYTGEEPPDPLPAVAPKDWFIVLQLFVQFHDVREKDKPRAHEVLPKLDAFAEEIGIHEYALQLLEKRDNAEKILALNVLGHLREPRAMDRAVALCDEEGAELSRAAAHCALRVDPRFIDAMLELVRERDDWVRSRVEAMLKEVSSADLDPAMSRAMEDADERGKQRLLDYLRFCSPGAARVICKSVLDFAKEDETVSAALRSLAPLAGENDHGLALRYCSHHSPIILLSALRVLRKCVRYDDRDLLVSLTAHRDYWVRLRAAEAVVQLYGDTGLAQEFASEHPDRYARDAIRQALAERKLFAMRKAPPDRRGQRAPVSAT